MSERNFLNVNEVYPILDLINRKVTTMQNKGQHYHFDSPLFSDGGNGQVMDTSQWQVESFEVVRDTSNRIDPNIIKSVIIVYRNGAIDTITLTRGLTPPVSTDVHDYEYINNLMIVAVTILTEFMGNQQEVVAKIFKENGYGNFQKVELTYNGELLYEGSDIDEDSDFENPNDFYDGNYPDLNDSDDDTAEDYADYEYTDEDEISPPDDGWADGFNPSQPEDSDLENVIEYEEDFADYDYTDEDESALEQND